MRERLSDPFSRLVPVFLQFVRHIYCNLRPGLKRIFWPPSGSSGAPVIPQKAHILPTGFFFALGFSILLLLSSCLRPAARTQSADYVQGQILVKFKETVSAERAQEINRMMGAEIIKIIRGLRVYHLKIPEDKTVPEMVRKYEALPEVEYAEPNYQVHIPTPPKD
jgi:hypothetical protein